MPPQQLCCGDLALAQFRLTGSGIIVFAWGAVQTKYMAEAGCYYSLKAAGGKQLLGEYGE